MASQNESHSFYVPSNGELPHRSGTNQSPWQPASHATMLSGGFKENCKTIVHDCGCKNIFGTFKTIVTNGVFLH